MYNNPTDSEVFDFMTHEPEFTIADIDKTKTVDLFAEPEKQWTKEGVHNALMVAGFTPVIGNAADLIDASLYAMEGEFGSAALSAAAAIPVIGHISSTLKGGQKILQEAVDKGDELVTLYRGVDTWYPGKMVKKGKFVGGSGPRSRVMGSYLGEMPQGTLWTSSVKQAIRPYTSSGTGPILKFEVPKSYIKKFGIYKPGGNLPQVTLDAINRQSKYTVTAFPEGLPKQFLTKVYHSFDDMMAQSKSSSYRQSRHFKKKQWIKENLGENSPQYKRFTNR